MSKPAPLVYKTLNNGEKVPAIGFGIGSYWRVKKQKMGVPPDYIMPELVESIENAIEVGFNHVDSAEVYMTRNELRTVLKDKVVPREELFLTDKHFCGSPKFPAFTDNPYDSVKNALDDLETDHLDLFLLHSSNSYYKKKQLSNGEQWDYLQKAKKEGLVKSIGLSNYSADSIENIMKSDTYEIQPQALQIEFHAMCQNKTPGIFDFCKKNNIQLFAYAPLAPITLVKEDNELKQFVRKCAEKYEKTEAQILLRWVSQSGVIPITTSSKIERLKDARDIYSFTIDNEDFEHIKNLGEKLKKTFYNW